MRGFLLYTAADARRNRFLMERYAEAAGAHGVELCTVITDEEPMPSVGPSNFVINRTRDHRLAAILEGCGAYVSNNARVCELANDKLKTYMALSGLAPMLPTVAADEEWHDFPAVIKPRGGHGGDGVAMVHDEADIREYLLARHGMHRSCTDAPISPDDCIVQPLASETGRDLRVYVVGGKPIAAMQRESTVDFRSNYSLGGHAYPRELTEEERGIVDAVVGNLSPDYIGIDIIYDASGGKRHAVLNEIEDPVGARMLYNNGIADAAGLHLEHILRRMGY